jgi:DNA-binding LacI/PurR family transcriptional regulator
LVRGDARPTGVVCYTDLESTLLVHALWPYGVAITGDVRLVAFNDVFGTRFMTPPLTTIGFDAAKIGELGTRLVLEQVDAGDAERKPAVMTVKPTLIVRGSTGPAATHESGVPKRASAKSTAAKSNGAVKSNGVAKANGVKPSAAATSPS